MIVLHSLRTPDGTTKYADLVVGASRDLHEVRFFSWQKALLGRYDVFHVHWPELLVRDSRRPWMRLLKRRLLDLLLLRLRLLRVPLVWTAHNVAPHEAGTPAEERALERLHDSVDLTVLLNRASPVRGPRVTVTVPHAHYGPAYAMHPQPAGQPGRVLHFGIIRPYKGVDGLLDAFREVLDPAAALRIVGHPHPGQERIVREAAALDPRITADLRFVDDRQLVMEICSSQLVVLPYRGAMHNSGSLLAALSLGRPVLVPASPTNDALSREVGPGWVHQYQGEITPDVLAAALSRTRDAPAAGPDLSARDWAVVGRDTTAAYELARGALRRGRGRTSSTASR